MKNTINISIYAIIAVIILVSLVMQYAWLAVLSTILFFVYIGWKEYLRWKYGGKK